MRCRIQILIRKRNHTKLERGIGTECQPLTCLISKLHPTDIRTVTRCLRTNIIVKHALHIGMINTYFTGLVRRWME